MITTTPPHTNPIAKTSLIVANKNTPRTVIISASFFFCFFVFYSIVFFPGSASKGIFTQQGLYNYYAVKTFGQFHIFKYSLFQTRVISYTVFLAQTHVVVK